MTLQETLRNILKHEGVVALASLGEDGPHLVNTWNSYVEVPSDCRMLVPVGGMHRTERHIAVNPDVLITLGTRQEQGRHGPGIGFLIKGRAEFAQAGPEFDRMKARFPWMRAVLSIHIVSATQTL
ncbi:MAG TPA: pyridoxamine 5'-phosphate oxidase family protein [Vicinamibacterales bacterium]|nr:pyridoxamine 5'-phosphate oxidase family protein [Vicinamibacterales bacterium]HPW22087.1 pyridoxamine 5'-phosphate oxidase family protein [Vicinamibacterales bacterium]